MGCGHKLIAGEAHLWGCQVGTELLWLQLDSIVVLVDCFLGRRAGDCFSCCLLSWWRMLTQGACSPCSEVFSSCFLEAFLASTKGKMSPTATETPTHRESLSLAIG